MRVGPRGVDFFGRRVEPALEREAGAFGGLGIAAIAVAVTTFTPATPFPGAAALLPCLGAAAIIWAGSGGHHPVGDALSLRPVVLVGLISYSLYLWHWPILSLWRYFALRELTPVETATAVAMAVAAAVVSRTSTPRTPVGPRW